MVFGNTGRWFHHSTKGNEVVPRFKEMTSE